MTLYIKGFSYFVTSITAPIASGRSKIAGWDSHPLENAAFARRTPTLAIQPEFLNGNNAAEIVIRLSVRSNDERITNVTCRATMTWARLLKQVFEIETCSECGGAVKVIACIEDPLVIKTILAHLKGKAPTAATVRLPESRVPPPVCVQRPGRQAGLFG